MRSFGSVWLACGFLANTVFATDSQNFTLKVDLGYSVYEGVVGNKSVSHWWGVRFAAPPVGDLRFRAPQEPVSTPGKVVKADTHGPLCYATRGSPSAALDPTQTEDCLFLDIYRPSANKTNLPVYVYIQGGGLNGLSDANKNGENWVNASDHEIIVVTINYRVGVFGFLASKELQKGGDLNTGMLDQRMALKWVQKYITKFGGDPKRVTVGGASAGAGSVNVQLLAYGGRNDGLFAAVHAESPSFGYVRTVGESQFQYDNLIGNVNCTKAQDTLACLRGLPATTIAEWSFGINTPNGGGGKNLFYWSNCVDGDLIRSPAYTAFEKGGFVKVPSLYGTDTNEGTMFVPKGADNTTDIDNFFKDNFPKFTKDQLSKIHRLFPPTEFQLPGTGKYFRALALAYGEMRYVCSSLFISNTLVSAGIKQSYQYRWDVVNPVDSAAGIGVRHTAGMAPIFGNSANGSAEAVVSPYIQQYFTSFIRTAGDPNKYRLPGSPVWEPYKKNGYNRIHFPNDIFEIGMETVQRRAQDYCKYFNKIGPSIGQ